MSAPRRERVARYEAFLAAKLQPDLRKLLERRDAIYAEIAEYLKLKNQIELIEQQQRGSDDPMRTMVDVGCDFFMQAEVTNATVINVLVGLDCHVEFTLDEAVQFIDTREKYLTNRADNLTEDAMKIKAQIKLVLAAIQEVLDA
ncbi:Prefoldin alpha-like protein [Chytriomyces sp. MP71]|nr:Prefoldin alpha-like protein [Chytriomyces sp. MP71]